MRSLGLGLGLGNAPFRFSLSGVLAAWDPAVGFTPESWVDASGNGNTATQATGADQGALVADALNGQPGVLFGAGQQMSHPLSYAGPATILCVAKTTASAGFHCALDTNGLFLMPQGPDGDWGMYMTGTVDAAPALTTFSVVSAQVTSPTNITFRTNGSSVTRTTGVSYYLSGNQSLGGSGSAGQDMLGTLLYLAVVGRVITATEVANWETYALRRWGI